MSNTTTAPPPQSAPSAKLIVPFMNSARQVFSSMVGVATTVGKPHLKMQPAPTYDVSAIVGFSGEVIGSVVVSFQLTCAIAMVKAFSGTEFEPSHPDFADAIGKGHTLARISGIPCVVIPISTPVGEFAVEVNVKPAK